MAEIKDKIFVAIGVSRPDGGLEKLPGAVTAATRMAAWASVHGYLTVSLDDEKFEAITVDLLREKVAAAIEQVTAQSELKRIVVFFAGHGAAQDVGDQYWMLTNWNKRPTEAVKVSALQRMLEYYGPKQVAIIGDACQEFSARFLDVIGSAVLDKPDEEPQQYELDQFFAVDVGKQAFMIRATDNEQAFCLFTEVLLDALEGDAPASAFEQIGTDRVVTSQSLAAHLLKTVAQEAGKYGVRMVPRPKPGFFTDRAYVKMPPPVVRSEPEAGAEAQEEMQSGIGQGSHLQRTFGEPGQVPGAVDRTEQRLVRRVHLAKPDVAIPDLDAQGKALLQARDTRRREFADEVAQATVRDHFETGAGICVSGATVVQLEAAYGEPSPVRENPNWYRIRLEDNSSLGWSDALITLKDGRICSVCAVQGFVAALHVVGDGSTSLFHRAIGAGDFEDAMAIDVLARLHSGLFGQDEIINTAAFLRHGKHRVITIGCIAAQFYDAIRDVDSLRQMASFYAQHRQPIPLDIVLYGGGTISESNGRLYANVPEVQTRKPRTPAEQQQRFTTEPTPGFNGYPIAGRVPWMRQAWSAVATVVCDDSAKEWREDALVAVEHLRPGAFTSFAPEGRDALAKLSRLSGRGRQQLAMT
jgi:hypothetical protein